MTKLRGFQVVQDKNRTCIDKDITLPTRADRGSAGYDFYLPSDVYIPGNSEVLVFTDVKAYMQRNEVLNVYIRSSLAIKKGLTLTNQVGIIDSTFYENEHNDGNIGISLRNNTMFGVSLGRGERVAQGVFTYYLMADDDKPLSEVRSGGIGSSGT